MILPDFLVDHPDGEIRVKGSRIGLDDIITSYQDGASAEMLALLFDTIPLATIYKTIGFYLENQAEIDAMVDRITAATEERRSQTALSAGLISVRQRLQDRRHVETA